MGISPPMTAATRPAPISSHPAFKWGVGAWFALLLGLGLFVMPSQVHLLLAERLGLNGMLSDPATIRAVLSLGAALLGLAIGLALALRVIALNDVAAEFDEPEADDEISAEEPDNIWLPDAGPQKNDSPSSRRTHPLRGSAARPEETEGPPPSVNDAPRRPFNPREDLAEEGIAPFLPDADPLVLDGEDITGGLGEDVVLPEAETMPGDPYFADAWHGPFDFSPGAEGLAETPTAIEEEDAIVLPPAPAALQVDEGEWDDVESAPASDTTEQQLETPPLPATALGDLSLEALTERLAHALEAAKPGSPDGGRGEEDPVIAFLRREAERDMSATGPGHRSSDPQAELRSALDKLSRVGKPK
ncbi:hypothetical protein K3181_08165 [Qipengyuania sp. YG27]|uniref:DUF308 domain-containing protein n=1 Tax=Qipengyuania mesophila TaxID=2867246 RepID=A0ABS7JUS7_9SPHN|nr:hypothetical protein [Qipengyuania mesophila]MBX7501413.1 hypothetical protein [Qipengyuania mesophila]